MNGEILSILEYLQREKGIKKEVLIQAVESALTSAVKKVIDVKEDEEIKVTLDSESGKIDVIVNGKKLQGDFGRIAAQTAKQVIIQKIREAEKDVVYNDFFSKVGQIISGNVYRFVHGDIIIDLLGKAEGLLPRKEQIAREDFRQGQTVRAYILDVKKESKGPQIILSRINLNFVKKLFELEVPEIYEGIVEIKSIARDPGERTKIAVCSKDTKVDSVGACVGMRGSRVKNIVNELQGEKIDIVRYSESIHEYISGALQPAKILEIRINKEKKSALVIVAEDQLSLAIGKHGQNVRLASSLVGWELDIRTLRQLEEAKQKLPKEQAKESRPKIINIPGLTKKILEALGAAGFTSPEALKNIKKEDLLKIKGIGEKKADKIIKQINGI
ncbi:MAG: transcription termination factor NusA [Candidatus Omnitrophota bacterium]